MLENSTATHKKEVSSSPLSASATVRRPEWAESSENIAAGGTMFAPAVHYGHFAIIFKVSRKNSFTGIVERLGIVQVKILKSIY